MSIIKFITQLVPICPERNDYGQVQYDAFENKQL